jgi:thymidylate kinase
MILEFAGLPCAGKTWHSTRLANSLRAEGIHLHLDQVATRNYRTIPSLGGIIIYYHWGDLLHTVTNPTHPNLRTSRRAKRISIHGIKSIIHLASYIDHIRHLPGSNPTPVISDQGLIQAIWSVSMRCDISPKTVINILRPGIPWPDVVIHLNTPPEVLTPRLAQRKRLPKSLPNGRRTLPQNLAEGEQVLTSIKISVPPQVRWVEVPFHGEEDELHNQLVAIVCRGLRPE